MPQRKTDNTTRMMPAFGRVNTNCPFEHRKIMLKHILNQNPIWVQQLVPNQ